MTEFNETHTPDGAQLKQFIERLDSLEREKSALSQDSKEIYAEVKAVGYDAKAVRKIMALRKKNARERAEEEAVLEVYMNSLGM